MNPHNRFCLCPECHPTVTEKRFASVTPIHERKPIIDFCHVCGAPRGFTAELVAICTALLDIQVDATAEQKEDHAEAIELARGVVRSRIRELTSDIMSRI